MASAAPFRTPEPAVRSGRFHAYAGDAAHQVTAIPDAGSCEEAAMLYLEFGDADGPGEIAVTVIDTDTGARQMFTLDLA